MRTKTLPLPAAPLRFHSLRIQPLLHFRFSLVIPARLQELVHSHPRALPPAAPHRFHSLRTQPLLLLHFRFSPLIPARLQEPLHSHPRALPPRLLPEPRRSLLPQWRLLRLRQRFPVSRPLPQAHRCSRQPRWSRSLRRPRRNDSQPDKFCPPSPPQSRQSPSTAPRSCPRPFRLY